MTLMKRAGLVAVATLGLAAPLMAQMPAAPPAAAPQTAVVAPAADAKVMLLGSVVQLRSGGPKLTIIYLANNIATVQWFQEGAGFKKEEFPVAALKLADDEDDEDEEDEDEDEEDDE